MQDQFSVFVCRNSKSDPSTPGVRKFPVQKSDVCDADDPPQEEGQRRVSVLCAKTGEQLVYNVC